jgi:N-acetylglucosamine-6-phosphate deacetylase
MIITAARAVIEGQERSDVWLDIREGLIHEIGDGVHPDAQRKFSGILIPGFIDIHCHGGGGYYFSNLNPDLISIAIQTHRQAGTTTLFASLVTADLDQLKSQIEALIPFVQRGDLAGVHLEGPYLSHAKCGAHDPALLRAPRLDEIKSLIQLGQGTIAMVTIAPELEGALESIGFLHRGLSPPLAIRMPMQILRVQPWMQEQRSLHTLQMQWRRWSVVNLWLLKS